MAVDVLRAQHLTKHYGTLTAVQDLSLDVREGELFGLLGPNGAGKTTAINMICGLLKPDSGNVLIRDAPIRGGDRAARACIGMCPQASVLWDKLTCLEQLQLIGEMYDLPGRVARQNGNRLLEQLDLADKRHRQARTLSGGMQRRLNIALALVHDPAILVLDEPEAGLDPQNRVKVREFLLAQTRRRTIILTTHNMDEADRMADRVAIIDHGQLLVVDTPEALKRSIGEGDVVEIQFKQPCAGCIAQVRGRLADCAPLHKAIVLELTPVNLVVRALDAVNLLPALIGLLSSAGLECGEVRLRANTLEDVFMQLTGRRLRE